MLNSAQRDAKTMTLAPLLTVSGGMASNGKASAGTPRWEATAQAIREAITQGTKAE